MQRRACRSSGSSVGGSKRQPGKGACCSPRHTPRMFHGTGALLPSRLEPSSCSLRDRPTSLSAVGESERVQGHGNGSTLASFLERSSWYASEACLASGVPGSSVSTSSPPLSLPLFPPSLPQKFQVYNSWVFVHTFALAVKNINAQVDLQLSVAHQCRFAC